MRAADYLAGILHVKRPDGDLYAAGGQITQTPNDGGSVQVQVSGGRFAKRTSETTADIYCGDCGQATALVQEAPLTGRDILDALTRARHVNCPVKAKP